MKLLKDFGMFWYEFVIGDDWKIAVAVVLALAATFGLMGTGAFSDHVVVILGTVLIVAFFSISLIIDVREHD
jgi:hypothetical protein